MAKLSAEERQRRLSEGQKLRWERKKQESQSKEGYRPEWFVKLAGGRNLLQIALDYKMTQRGSLDRSVELQASDRVLLQFAYDTWKTPAFSEFDDAVKNLIHAALQESR